MTPKKFHSVYCNTVVKAVTFGSLYLAIIGNQHLVPVLLHVTYAAFFKPNEA
jgi:hypothetical protein